MDWRRGYEHLERKVYELESHVSTMELRLRQAGVPSRACIPWSTEGQYANLRTLLYDLHERVRDLEGKRPKSVQDLNTLD